MTKVAYCIYCRTGSKRFPSKYCKAIINNTPMLNFIIKNATHFLPPENIFILTGDDASCDPIISIAKKYNISVLRGSEVYPVLRTFQVIKALKRLGFTHLCRICGDSPFYPFKYLEQLFTKACSKFNVLSDHLCINNTLPKTYPNGVSIEFYPLNIIIDTISKHKDLCYSDSLTDIIKKQSDT